MHMHARTFPIRAKRSRSTFVAVTNRGSDLLIHLVQQAFCEVQLGLPPTAHVLPAPKLLLPFHILSLKQAACAQGSAECGVISAVKQSGIANHSSIQPSSAKRRQLDPPYKLKCYMNMLESRFSTQLLQSKVLEHSSRVYKRAASAC